jgi:outer membrane protein W
MIRQNIFVAVLVASGILASSMPAVAQQSVSFQVGVFTPRAEDARVTGDVLATNQGVLHFAVRDFKAMSGGVEWLVQTGQYVELGVGIGFYQRSVPSVYEGWVNADGSEIQQDLKLRIAPMTATLKLLPFGARRAVQPYIGGGLAVYFWRYSETGQFVDFSDNSIYRETYVANGTSVGPVAVLGVRARISDKMDAGVEVRAQWGQGHLTQDFLGDRIDLGGINTLGTLRFRF